MAATQTGVRQEKPIELNTQTASYTLVLIDRGKDVEMNVASANNLTIPLNSSVAFPIGTEIIISQKGAGQTTIVATGGVTINTSSTLKLRTQHSVAVLLKRATDTWDLAGDLEETSTNYKAPLTSLQSAMAVWRSLLNATGSHIATRVAGTYGFGQGQPIAISGTGTLYALASYYIDSADFPTIEGKAPKFRIKGVLYVNDVAPTGNFTFGLHAITRPGTSGGAGLNIYTIAAAISGSTFTVTTPAADSSNQGASAEFALPSNGHYIIGVVTTATVATNSHLHLSAKLEVRNN